MASWRVRPAGPVGRRAGTLIERARRRRVQRPKQREGERVRARATESGREEERARAGRCLPCMPHAQQRRHGGENEARHPDHDARVAAGYVVIQDEREGDGKRRDVEKDLRVDADRQQRAVQRHAWRREETCNK